MTYISVDRQVDVLTTNRSYLSASYYQSVITWENKELLNVNIRCLDQSTQTGFSFDSKQPEVIQDLRDLLSAVLVELGIEEIQDDTVRE